ncbi:hypothetical protein ACFS5N_03245 [Mucilaginibacter ximonensis]|uniref:Uncharacterized protein n=1 Tax=Mucilaginibacter ximonensis TaxID=538021 RepID=A0ABW5Y7X1_9SPHI
MKVSIAKYLLGIGWLISVSYNAEAQFNDTTHYHIALAPTGSINRTHTSYTYLLNNALKFDVKKKNMTIDFTNTWVYGRQN